MTPLKFIEGLTQYIRSIKSKMIEFDGDILFPNEEINGSWKAIINGAKCQVSFLAKRGPGHTHPFIQMKAGINNKLSVIQFTISGSNFSMDKENNKFYLNQKLGITIGRKVIGLDELFNMKMASLGFNADKIITSGSLKKPNYEVILKELIFWMSIRAQAKNELEIDLRNDDLDEESKTEGGTSMVTIKRYERDPKLRAKAIKIHGTICKCCGFDFEKVYGEWGAGFIEIHHIKPLSEYVSGQKTNPKTDLTVLCANCHRMVHKNRKIVLSIEELKEKMK